MKNIFELRRLYFIGLFSSIIYPSLLIIILGKTPLKDVSFFYVSLIAFSSTIILEIMYLKVKNLLYKYYKLALSAGHSPLILGFLLSIIEKNYLYILIAFPVFLIIYLILIPVKSNEN